MNLDEFFNSTKYNKDLKEFLYPIIQQLAAMSIKKFGTKMKTYA